MKAVGFPDTDAHRRLHHDLVRQVTDMQRRYVADPAAVPAADAFKFLSDWLMRHIVAEDMRMQPYVLVG